MTPGIQGSTFGGNPLGVAVAKAVLEVVSDPDFLAQVTQKGEALRAGLEQLAADQPSHILDVRGAGLMLGLKLNVPNTDFVAAARHAGLLCVPAGDNVVRLLPPLTVSDAEITDALSMIGRALAQTHPQ